MAKAVKDLPDEIQELIEIREWDMRTLDGNRRYLELQAKSLPAIAIDGKLTHESLIPQQEELVEEITRQWQKKTSV